MIGLGSVGVASAGAGLGTSAYFSDEESFDDNTLSAGELDLLVDYELSYDQGSAGSGGTSGTINGDVQVVDENGDDVAEGDAVSLTLDDVKPGDYGEVTISIHICDNPAYLRLSGEITENDENGQKEPELEAEGEDTDGLGELAQVQQADHAAIAVDGRAGLELLEQAAVAGLHLRANTLVGFLSVVLVEDLLIRGDHRVEDRPGVKELRLDTWVAFTVIFGLNVKGLSTILDVVVKTDQHERSSLLYFQNFTLEKPSTTDLGEQHGEQPAESIAGSVDWL
jgi:predicted ribosomally synthesized peptide with SipW-like signal peptide